VGSNPTPGAFKKVIFRVYSSQIHKYLKQKC
jgi:hypothetical protein